MCGIIGYVGSKSVKEVLLKGLKRLEYRGYDSSGIAFFNGDSIQIQKSVGKIAEVENLVHDLSTLSVNGAIGHTRWATHGAPNRVNSHPHRVKDVVLVHNGIIENYREIREWVEGRGLKAESETDSELFGFLVVDEMEQGTPFVEAVRRSVLKTTGSSSVVVMCERHPGVIVGIRNGSPLVAANSEGFGTLLASDAQPVLDYTDWVYFLENGDMAVCIEEGVQFFDLKSGQPIERKQTRLEWSPDRLDKNGYEHYMLKEIHEQPKTIRETLKMNSTAFNDKAIATLSESDRISLIACGTSWHASLLGKYWIEEFAGIPTEAELASEYRYRHSAHREKPVILGVSQSGETADTLAVIQEANRKQVPTFAITNVRGSTMSREAKSTFYTVAGPEIGVASTKAFTAQMAMLLLLASQMGKRVATETLNSSAEKRFQNLDKSTQELPMMIERMLSSDSAAVKATLEASRRFLKSKGFFFMGRGYSYPLALEGALKLKEIAYVHAEGYAAGELKHGPIAMLEPGFTVVTIAPQDHWHEKTLSNLQEVKARGANTVTIGNAEDDSLRSMSDAFIPLENVSKLDEALLPFLVAPILQLLSYDIAVLKGTDVDQPRNLAKSVTVE